MELAAERAGSLTGSGRALRFAGFRSASVGMTIRVEGKCGTAFKSERSSKTSELECPTHTSRCDAYKSRPPLRSLALRSSQDDRVSLQL